MYQIRIARRADQQGDGRRFVCEWMEASSNNRWFLKTRLAEALQACGPGSHWVETRESQHQYAVLPRGTALDFPRAAARGH